MPKYNVEPNTLDRPKAVRGAYLYNLVDCLHTCILRRDLPRARRAWAILVRCPDVNWRDRWSWALYLLTAEAGEGSGQSQSQARARTDGQESDEDGPPPNPYSQPSQSQHSFSQREPGQDAFLFLRDIRLSSKEADKPAVLAEMVLHLIAVGRYRHALDELTTYLLDYPYTLSAPLHTYAGMVCFYLAQPVSMRKVPKPKKAKKPQGTSRRRETTADSERTEDTRRKADTDDSDEDTEDPNPPPPDANYIRQARGWFQSALKLDPTEAVAKGFLHLIDKPAQDSDDERDLDESFDQSRDVSEADVDMDRVEGKDEDEDEGMDISPVVRTRPLDVGAYYSGDSEEDEDMPPHPEVGERSERSGRRRSARFPGSF